MAEGRSWFAATLAFGLLWSLWYAPLFLVGGSYQNGLLELGWPYVANFFMSVLPLELILTWAYVGNDRSMASCVVLNFFANLCQEKVTLTPETKCIETLVIVVAAAIIVLRNRDMLLSRK